MKIGFTIELDREFVFNHRDDDVLPVDIVKQALADIIGVVCESASLVEAQFVVDEKTYNSAVIHELLRKKFLSAYPDEKVPYEFRKDGEKATAADDGSADVFLGDKSDKENNADGKKTAAADAVIARVKSLVGADEFKALADEIVKIAPLVKSDENNRGVFMRRSYLFSVGDGCGLSSYLGLLGELITKAGIAHSDYRVTEKKLDVFKDSAEPFQAMSGVFGNHFENVLRIVCIDISEWMGHTDNKYFREFLRNTEKISDGFVIVIRVPFVDKDVLERIRGDLGDVMFVKSVSVPPFTSRELKEYAENTLGEYGIKVADGAWQYFERRITEEKRDGRFYGVATVKKVVDELLFNKLLGNATAHKTSRVLSKSDMLAVCADPNAKELSGEAQLDKLVGGAALKTKIREIIAQIELAANDKDRPCIHMQFIGNPGTGKTTVARIIGKILKERGVLTVGGFHEHSGRDFCGRYVGETAPKTASICRDAYGSVLFIDEAYSLYRGDDGGRDFGVEALDTLIAEMENHRSDFVVILAGYTDDMNRLMQGNRGLKSRIPYTIEFPNFTREELYEIYAGMATERFKCDDDMLEAAKEFFTGLPDELLSSKDFSNARFVRNLFERTWAKASMRCQLGKIKTVRFIRDDFERAKSEKEFTLNTKVRPRIGFSY